MNETLSGLLPYILHRDVNAGATVAPKFSGGGADSAPPSQRWHQKFPHVYISTPTYTTSTFQELNASIEAFNFDKINHHKKPHKKNNVITYKK